MFVVNLIAFILFAVDKYKSKKSKWRISERTLIVISLIGGSVGALLAMKKFHHKTKHKKFTIGVPLILVAQITIFIFLISS
ncbi:MAG: DUF1294 domain-containing protein [Bacteroidales bacterium]|nr:DUF1294 domain-containing protein [Bacteroidales bacterium]